MAYPEDQPAPTPAPAGPFGYFFGNAPANSPLSYQALQTRRKIAESLLGKRSPFPKNAGEGLTYLGEALADRSMMADLDAREVASQKATEAATQNLLTGGAPPAPPAGGRSAALTPANNEQSAAFDNAPPSAAQIGPTEPGTPLPPPRPVYDRGTQLSELQQNPETLARLAAMGAGEADPGASTQERQAYVASALDRARARNIPVAQALEPYTGPGSRGYYPPASFSRGAAALSTPGAAAAYERDVLDPVLRGADPGGAQLGFTPTGNASGGVASRGENSGRYNAAGQFPGSSETFVQQEPPDQLARLEAGRFPAGSRDAIAGAQVASLQPPGGSVSDVSGPGPSLPPDAIAQAGPPPNPPIPTNIPPLPPAQGPVIPQLPANMPPDYERPRPIQPDMPKATPRDPIELNAERTLLTTDNPEIQRRAKEIIDQKKADRSFTDARNVEAYKSQMAHYSTLENAWQAEQAGRRAGDIKVNTEAQQLAALPQRLAQEAQARQGALPTAPLPGLPPSGGPIADPRLGTPASAQRTGVPQVPPVPAGVAPQKWAELQAPEMAKAVSAFQTAVPEFNKAIATLQEAKNHPGQEYGVGGVSEIAKRIPGTQAYDFGTIMKQIGGKNFLNAYQTLKGGGAISNIEGSKAEEAQARLSTAQTPEGFKRSLADFEDTLRSDLEQVQRRTNQPVTAWRRQPGDNSTFAPDIGQVGIRGGKLKVYQGGDPGLERSYREVQ